MIDDQLIGLGSGDMKAAIAAMIYAAAALRDLGDFPGKLSLALTADEENGSQLGSKWLATEGYIEADVCVIGEPSGVHEEWESIHLVSRGAALFKVIVLGTQMHSSVSDQLPGVNATLKMAELALRMQRELRDYLTFDDHEYCRYGPTVNVGVMAQAGVTYGVFPGRAEFATDVRTLPGMTEEQVKLDVQRFLDDAMAADPELNATLDWYLMVEATEIDGVAPHRAVVGRRVGEGARTHAATRRVPGRHRCGVHPGRGRRALHRSVRPRPPPTRPQPERVDAPRRCRRSGDDLRPLGPRLPQHVQRSDQ